MIKLTTIIIALLLINTAIAVDEEQRQGMTKPEIEEWNFPPTAYKLESYPARKETTTYDFAYGSTQLSTLILSIIILFASLLSLTKTIGQRILSAWNFLSLAGVMFFMQQIFVTLDSFNIYSSTLQHFIPAIIIGLLIAGILRQKSIMAGCYK